jgi:hypothetical protein
MRNDTASDKKRVLLCGLTKIVENAGVAARGSTPRTEKPWRTNKSKIKKETSARGICCRLRKVSERTNQRAVAPKKDTKKNNSQSKIDWSRKDSGAGGGQG